MRYKTKYRAIQCDTKPNTERYSARRSQTAVDTNTERCSVRQDAIRGRTMRDGLKWQYKFKYRAIQYKTNAEPNNAVQIEIQSNTTQDRLRWQSIQIKSASMRQNTIQGCTVQHSLRSQPIQVQSKAIQKQGQSDTMQHNTKCCKSMAVSDGRQKPIVLQCNTKPEQGMCEKSGFKT